MLAGVDPKSDERLSLKKPRLIIGSKLDTSQIFFAQLLRQAVEAAIPNAQCETRIPNGGSLRNFADVKNRWIDMYIDYTGTCMQYFNIDHRNKSDEEIIEELNFYGKSVGLTWLKPLGASEDYCLVMSKDKADYYKIKSIRDLKSVGTELVFSADPEFLNRKDCYLGLKNYGINFKSVAACKVSERYILLESGKADVFVGYETDPQIGRGDVMRLEDPDQFFPRYMAVPLVSTNALEKIPELEHALSKLHNIMTTQDLVNAVNKISMLNGAHSEAREQAISILNR
jgi:osmoprotectant transport system permease protein